MSWRDLCRRVPAWQRLAWTGALLLTAGLAFDVSPWLRGDLDWRWTYRPFVHLDRILIVSAVLAAYIGLAAAAWSWAARASEGAQSNRRDWLAVSLAVVAAIGVQILVQTLADPDPWRELLLRTSSPFLQGYWNAALDVPSIGDYLQRFPQIAPSYDVPHVQRHPPGFVVYFAVLQRLTAALPELSASIARGISLYRCEYWPHLYLSDGQYAAVLGGLPALPLSAASLVPLFAVGRRLLGPRAALGAVLLSPLIPGFAIWAGHWDQAFPVVTTSLLWLLHRGVGRWQGRYWLSAGLLVSGALFFTHAMLVLAVFVVTFLALHLVRGHVRGDVDAKAALRGGGAFALGLSGPWFVYWALVGVSYLDIYRANTESHYALESNYLARLFYNPYDFVLFLGYAVGFAALASIWQTARDLRLRKPLSEWQTLVGVTVLTFGALVLSGVARAETGRVWMFLFPLFVLLAFSAPGAPAAAPVRWAAMAALVAAQTVVMQVAFFSERDVHHIYDVPAAAQRVGAQVGQGIELVAFELSADTVQPGGTTLLSLYWQTHYPTDGYYVAFVHLYDSARGMAAQRDAPPREGRYPTTCWQPGEIVSDEVALEIPPDALPGMYDLLVGLYEPAADYARLPTAGPRAREDDRTIALARVDLHP